MAKIKKQSLVDQIYSRLREDILNLRFPLGSRINVNEIQDELGRNYFTDFSIPDWID